jgi:hypothetical protein
LVDIVTDNIEHFLDITLKSLELQKIEEDFEIILSHRYPEDVSNIISKYSGLNIKVIKEKHSLWHDLGDNYKTVNNNRNTGIIESSGDILLFLDDYTFFNSSILENVSKNFKEGYTTTFRGCRRLRFKTDNDVAEIVNNRSRFIIGDLTGGFNFINNNPDDIIPIQCTWSYGCSISKDDCLSINGFDEIYDGNFGGTDEDFGLRHALYGTKYDRKLGKETIYEFHHPTSRSYYNSKPKNSDMFRIISKQLPKPLNLIANSWKPTKNQVKRYEKWYNSVYGSMDNNWNKFMDIPQINIGKLNESRIS